MLQIQFSACKEDAFEFVGRVSTFSREFDGIDAKPRLVSSSDSGCVVSFNFDVNWCWYNSRGYIDTLVNIARKHDLYVEVVGVLYN